KLNLTFAVLGPLPEGFHEVETLMQAVDLEDELTFTIEPSDKMSIEITCTKAPYVTDVPLDETNLVAKALRLFAQEHEPARTLKISVHIEKVIPVSAGLAGGSSNAAAALVVLNRYYGSRISRTKLEDMAAALGSDVPFCIAGGTQVGRNRGEKLSLAAAIYKMHFVIVKPREVAIATPWIYNQYDQHIKGGKKTVTIKLDEAVRALHSADIDLATRNFANAFEPIVYERFPQLQTLRNRIVELGAWGCYLTGSGPTLFALVPHKEAAVALKKRLVKEQADGNAPWQGEKPITLDCWIAESLDTGARVVEASGRSLREKETV
ncbi:MAG: 4-(cytidine 5'-diphospho)-2-C-methyl-D-erythritol kinase, partial [Terriglobales bacterium]